MKQWIEKLCSCASSQYVISIFIRDRNCIYTLCQTWCVICHFDHAHKLLDNCYELKSPFTIIFSKPRELVRRENRCSRTAKLVIAGTLEVRHSHCSMWRTLRTTRLNVRTRSRTRTHVSIGASLIQGVIYAKHASHAKGV